MTAAWKDSNALRPNPYLDWEKRTRNGAAGPAAEGEPPPWCSQYIRVKPGGEYRANLIKLRDLARRKNNEMHIWMSADELANLERAIESNKL